MKCNCKSINAWACAVAQNLGEITCKCSCHPTEGMTKAAFTKTDDTEWKPFEMSAVIQSYRPGLRGVWDHLINVVRKQGLSPLVNSKVTITFWYRANADVKVGNVSITTIGDNIEEGSPQ